MHHDPVIKKLIEMDAYMREELVTRREFSRAVGELTDHVDGFAKLHGIQESEMAALQSKTDRLEGRIEVIERS